MTSQNHRGRESLIKFAPEGYPFMAAFAALSAAALLLPGHFGRVAAGVLLVVALFMAYFFRDPERTPAEREGYLAPADGKVIVVKEAYEGGHLKKNALQISIFMSPLDVHVNRAPCEGEVVEVKHTPGRYFAAYKDDAHLKNENTAMLLKCGEDSVLLRQVAGFVARRTVCRVRPGDALARGQRFGIIKFSSRVDVYLPLGSAAKVKTGDRVRAGETVIAVGRRKKEGM
ncbi:MAG: phosphatidylserine decarboxylase family protein [Thermodesulfovibrionales bacterium]|nr:phosphatidylserine decarboxylase family protein [Thermodesulfovibrionales bacterium]